MDAKKYRIDLFNREHVRLIDEASAQIAGLSGETDEFVYAQKARKIIRNLFSGLFGEDSMADIIGDADDFLSCIFAYADLMDEVLRLKDLSQKAIKRISELTGKLRS